ncbi:MAG: DUF6787 family protein [Pseudomonadota bacterium]|nr:DUF6787 family protein [Pseudomonadota bacterium]
MLLLLKKIFKTDSTYQLCIVFLVFGISGSLSVYVSKPLLELLNYEEFISNSIIQIILRILIIFPIYQIILLAVASIFGEFNYFWKFGKKFWKKFKK